MWYTLEEMGRKSQNHQLSGQHNNRKLLYSVLAELNALSFSVDGKTCVVLVAKGREKQSSITLPGHISQGQMCLSKDFFVVLLYKHN